MDIWSVGLVVACIGMGCVFAALCLLLLVLWITKTFTPLESTLSQGVEGKEENHWFGRVFMPLKNLLTGFTSKRRVSGGNEQVKRTDPISKATSDDIKTHEVAAAISIALYRCLEGGSAGIVQESKVGEGIISPWRMAVSPINKRMV